MAMIDYDPRASVREARSRYFELFSLDDGGYTSPTFTLRMGPLALTLPNPPARRRAVRVHDLHHVATGYPADMRGECQIAAWELASGCRGFVAAWIRNALALAMGLILYPRTTAAAFARGRRSGNLYGQLDGIAGPEAIEPLLALSVEELRGRLGLAAPAGTPGCAAS